MKSNLKYVFSLALVFLAACGSQPTPTPTPQNVDGAGNAAVDLLEQQMYINLTEQAVKAETVKQGAIMTATQQVMDATATENIREEREQATQQAARATQQVWGVTVEAARAQDAATAQAVADRATSTAVAQATATQMAVLAVTATVSAKETERADRMTEQAPIVEAQVHALEIETKKAQLELDRMETTSWVRAWGGWILCLVVIVAAGFWMWEKSQVGVVPADDNGNYPLVSMQVNGQWRITKPSNMEGPVLELNKSGTIMPTLVAPEIQRQTTHGAQVVAAVQALPPGYPRQVMGIVSGLTPQTGAVNIQVVTPERMGQVLDEVEGGLLEG